MRWTLWRSSWQRWRQQVHSHAPRLRLQPPRLPPQLPQHLLLQLRQQPRPQQPQLQHLPQRLLLPQLPSSSSSSSPLRLPSASAGVAVLVPVCKHGVQPMQQRLSQPMQLPRQRMQQQVPVPGSGRPPCSAGLPPPLPAPQCCALLKPLCAQ
jgi:hypothetical protein